jgi:hypothetical protein
MLVEAFLESHALLLSRSTTKSKTQLSAAHSIAVLLLGISSVLIFAIVMHRVVTLPSPVAGSRCLPLDSARLLGPHKTSLI